MHEIALFLVVLVWADLAILTWKDRQHAVGGMVSTVHLFPMLYLSVAVALFAFDRFHKH